VGPPRLGLGRIGQEDLKGDGAIGIGAGVHGPQAEEGVEQESRADQDHHGDGGLAHYQSAEQAPRAPAG
jgi:hypothetical protein